MTWIARGMGMALGLALWPVALPVLLIAGLVAATKGQQQPPAPDAVLTVGTEPLPPVIPGLREQHLAIVTERNRQHLENTYLN